MKTIRLFLVFLLMGGLIAFNSCEEDEPGDLEISSIEATGTDLQTGNEVTKDLNAPTAATDVPLQPTITIMFNKAVDVTTAVKGNFSITAGTASVDLSVQASDKTVTLTLNEELERGTQYTLTISAGVQADDDGSFSEATRSFTTAGQVAVVPPKADNQLAYYPFDGDANDDADDFDPTAVVSVTYSEDRHGNVNSAAKFDGDASIIEVPNGDQLLGEKVTISMWMYLDTVNHKDANGNTTGHFVYGIANFHGLRMELNPKAYGVSVTGGYEKQDGTTGINGMFFNGDGKTGEQGGWVGVAEEKDLGGKTVGDMYLCQQWAHLVYVYDGSTNQRYIYINGELMERDDLEKPDGTKDFVAHTVKMDDLGEGEVRSKALAFGFIHGRETTWGSTEPWGNYELPTSKHFKGMLDDVRFFSAALTASEVQQLYNDEKAQ